MEIKVRDLDKRIVDELNAIAKSYDFSREELIRNILKDYVDSHRLQENPLYETIEETNTVLHDVKELLLSLENIMRKV